MTCVTRSCVWHSGSVLGHPVSTFRVIRQRFRANLQRFVAARGRQKDDTPGKILATERYSKRVFIYHNDEGNNTAPAAVSLHSGTPRQSPVTRHIPRGFPPPFSRRQLAIKRRVSVSTQPARHRRDTERSYSILKYSQVRFLAGGSHSGLRIFKNGERSSQLTLSSKVRAPLKVIRG